MKIEENKDMKVDEKIVYAIRERATSTGNFLCDAAIDIEKLVDLLKTNLVSGKIPKEMMAFYPIAERLADAINSFNKFSYLVYGEEEEKWE